VPAELWVIGTPSNAFQFDFAVDNTIVLDSSSFRPALASQSTQATEALAHYGLVTSFQGSRYHADVVRAIGESQDALGSAAHSIASLASSTHSRGLVLDFQEMAGEDLIVMTDVARAIADSARAASVNPITMIIPANDTAAYPGATLARIADALIVRLFPEHGPRTPPGPIVSPSWFARGLGARAAQVGVTRIVAEIPADGILWRNDGSAHRVTYAESMRLAEQASTTFVRDPASVNLHASSLREGWEIWLADHVLIERLIADARRIGVTRFAFAGIDGTDPQLWQSLLQLKR
jgi:spore germination protein YaaH